MGIRAPYNFVPLSDKVFFPDWADQISQDIPFEDGEDGIIEVELTNISPLFTRQGEKKGEQSEFSAHVVTENGNKIYYIPSTTLKGCFRNVLEIISFGKFSRFNNDSFGYRSFTTQTKGLNYPAEMANVKDCGWLIERYDGSKIKYYFYRCLSGIQKIRHSDIKNHYSSFYIGADHETAEKKQKSLCYDETGILYPQIHVEKGDVTYKEAKNIKAVPTGDYQIVCTGYMEGKKIEYLFSTSQSAPIEVPKEIVEEFETVHRITPYYGGQNGKNGFLKGLLHSGEPIPVFCQMDAEKKTILSMGISRMYKVPFSTSVKKAVERQSIDSFSDSMDLAEAIFGVTGSNTLRGRVQVTNAFCNELIPDPSIVTGVLGQPQASYYPLYLHQDNRNGIVNYSSDNAKIAGWKRYRVLKGTNTLELPKGNNNENVLTRLRPIPAGKKFTGRIYVHNMRPIEIGALLSAITLHDTEGAYHTIGQAKSFGYGKTICSVTLNNFRYDKEQYINMFDEVMSGFSQTKLKSTLRGNLSINQLYSIASETHTEDIMRMMSLEEYESFKEDRNFTPLTEERSRYSVSIDESQATALFITQLKKEVLSRASSFVAKERIEDAITELNNSRLELIKLGCTDLSDIKSVIDEYQHLKNQIESDIQKRRDEIERENALARAEQKRIEAEADRKNENQVPISEKIKNLKYGTIEGNVKTWMSLNGKEVLTEQDKAEAIEKLKQLYESASNKDKKDFDKNRSKFESLFGTLD